jgi:N-acetylglucosaminyl-diphospho-decaprenol L-rhamnosyltransferase
MTGSENGRSQPPDLSVAVVTYNGRELALATLRSAIAHAGPIEVEWFVADNGSSDGTPEAIEHALPQVTVLRGENLGFAHGNNVVLEQARGRYMLLLNPDVEVKRGTLAGLVHELDRRPEIGAASVIQRATAGHVLPSIRRFPAPWRNLAEALFVTRVPPLRALQELDQDIDAYFEERRVDWVCGAFLIARREAIEDIGPLDERFFLYSEEVDWCRRIRDAGWEIRHLPVMEVVHHEGPVTPARVAEECHSRVLFARKHFGRFRALAIHSALTLRHALRMVLLAAPALVRPDARPRLHCAALAFAVLTRVKKPPLSTAARAGNAAAVAEAAHPRQR